MKTPFKKKKIGPILIIAFSLIPVIILLLVRSNLKPSSILSKLSTTAKPSAESKKSRNKGYPSFEGAVFETVCLDSVSERVTREGGQIALPDKAFSVTIPPEALEKEENLTLSCMSALDEYGNHLDTIYKCEPEGLEFKKPVEMNFSLPFDVDPEIIEVVYLDTNTQKWIREEIQQIYSDSQKIVSKSTRFSSRRIRVIPGKEKRGLNNCGRATFYLESDAGNNYEELVNGQWRYIRRRSRRYREVMRMHRSGRQELIKAGLLRSITGARPRIAVFRNDTSSAAMPPNSPEAKTGWVRIIRLDHHSQPTGQEVIARVNDYGPGLQARKCGVIIDLSFAAIEKLGLTWGEDFGVTGYKNNIAFLKVKNEKGKISRYLRVKVEAVTPDFLG